MCVVVASTKPLYQTALCSIEVVTLTQHYVFGVRTSYERAVNVTQITGSYTFSW